MRFLSSKPRYSAELSEKQVNQLDDLLLTHGRSYAELEQMDFDSALKLVRELRRGTGSDKRLKELTATYIRMRQKKQAEAEVEDVEAAPSPNRERKRVEREALVARAKEQRRGLQSELEGVIAPYLRSAQDQADSSRELLVGIGALEKALDVALRGTAQLRKEANALLSSQLNPSQLSALRGVSVQAGQAGMSMVEPFDDRLRRVENEETERQKALLDLLIRRCMGDGARVAREYEDILALEGIEVLSDPSKYPSCFDFAPLEERQLPLMEPAFRAPGGRLLVRGRCLDYPQARP